MEVSWTKEGMILTHHKYTKELLHTFGIQSFRKVATPLPLNLKLSANEGDLCQHPKLYRSIIRKLNFLTNTRPDLSYIVQTLSQYMQTPRILHWEALAHTLNCVHHTCGQGIIIKENTKLTLQAYCDLDWAACPNTRSVSGYLLLFGNTPLCWK